MLRFGRSVLGCGGGSISVEGVSVRGRLEGWDGDKTEDSDIRLRLLSHGLN